MHSHETRQKNDIHIAGTRTTSAKQCIRQYIPTVLTSIPTLVSDKITTHSYARPPRQSDFFDLSELSISDGHCLNEGILLGDFNTDILLPTNNVLVNALRNFEHAFGLKQLIVEPTRVALIRHQLLI